MKIHNDIQQGSESWLALRLGKFTASDFHILMGEGQTKRTILLKKAAERITGVLSDADGFTSVHTERGNKQEREARELYSVLSFNEVDEVGFVELNKYIGCSPDGLIGDDGGVEIKCKDNHNHLFSVINDYIDPQHKTQCQFNMYVTGRKWWDYFLYNRNFKTKGHIIKISRDEEYISKIEECIHSCERIIQSHITKFSEM
jgi:hypothetical protein